MWRAFPQRGGRAVDEHSEIYVGLDVAIARHAVAVADGERSGFRVATLVGRFATRLLTEPTPAVRPWSAGTRLHAPFRPSAGLRGRLPNPGKAVIRLTLEQRVI